ncbi:MAG: GNAT family N-acetyltransferase [Planctomycetes bacterium]|nr:GNAT family N-acetyltransferase [Planctomycetota bacterium]
MDLDESHRPVLDSQRLVLRALEMSDAARVAALAGDKRIYDVTLLIPHPYELKHAEEWITKLNGFWERWREDWTMAFGLRLKSTNELIGAMGLVGTPKHKRAEFGYWLGVSYWGNGYATEAARVVVAFAQQELGVNRLEAGVFDGNEASMKVLRKIGFVEEGILRQKFLKDGKFVDDRVFANLTAISRA